jgi:hypothetical protein
MTLKMRLAQINGCFIRPDSAGRLHHRLAHPVAFTGKIVGIWRNLRPSTLQAPRNITIIPHAGKRKGQCDLR